MRKLSTDLIKSGSFTGSFSGSVTGLINSASYALTASTVLNAFSLTTGSTYSITASWSNYSISSSFSNTSTSSSYANTASNLSPVAQDLIPSVDSLYNLGSITNKWKDLYVSSGSIYIGNVSLNTSGSTLFANVQPIVTLNTASGQIEVSGITASLSSSFATNAGTINNTSSTVFATTGSNLFNGNQTVQGDVRVVGNLIAEQYIVSSSVSYFTSSTFDGSTKFGDSSQDTHQFTGSVLAPNITGSLLGSSSYAETSSLALIALTSSYINVATNAVSSSYAATASISFTAVSSSFSNTSSLANTASYVLNSVSSSFASTSSYSLNSVSSSYSNVANSATSASYALTSSFALSGVAGNEGGGLFTVTSAGFNYNIAGYSGSFPTITVVRNQLYYFNVSGVSASHPFALRLSSGNTSAVPGTTNNDPVNGLANTSTLIIYRVPNDAPNSIVYQCVIHSGMIGTINIVDQYASALTTGSTYPITASWAINALSSSFATTALSASYAPGGGGTSLITGSTYPITASWSNYALTASYALVAGSGGGGGSSSTSSLIGQTFVPTASVSQLSLTQSVSNNDQILVILDGLVQSRTGSYTVTGSTLNLTENADSGSIIDVRFLAGSSVSSSYATTSSYALTTAPRTVIYRYGTTSVVNPGSYTNTIIKYDTAVTDSTGWYDNTNGRFTPTVAGWYQVSAGARVYSSGGEGYLALRKNGTDIMSSGGGNAVNSVLSLLVYFNGSSDYIQLYSIAATAITNAQNSTNTPFTMVYMTS